MNDPVAESTVDFKKERQNKANQLNVTGKPINEFGSQLAVSMTEASIDSMVALDRELNIISWNNATAQWSGYSYAEVAGKNLFDVFPAAKSFAGLEVALQRALKGIKSFLTAVDGAYIHGHFEVHIVPLKDTEGIVVGIMQIMHDVAHRLKAENELRELNLKLSRQFTSLQQANDELAAFAKIAAHDLKEPLRKIYTFVEMIMVHEAGKLSDGGRSNFRRIQKSVQRMGLLTDDVVNFCEVNHQEERRQVNLFAVLANEVIRAKSEIDQSGASIDADHLPSISGYPAALVHIIRQLLSNAIKFRRGNAKPEIRIGCELIDSEMIADANAEADRQYYHLYVADNGIGFEPQYAGRIFGMFQRLNPEGTYKGSGMGLAIARKAAQLHNGFIAAESTPGTGSIFHCYIPTM